ncbi:L1TD1: LINE-1 type transposase domain-containing protein 1 [Crotalus adamanteus]|uniref:L1TD1: LINE-1 type transposase domain-containing protein 1 n=1 Tax=Crotalus adamanteus TaxID=8729 RepID=A0AAW1C8L6_CROAD
MKINIKEMKTKEDLKQIKDKIDNMDVRITDLAKQSQDMTRNITEVKTRMGEHDKVLKSDNYDASEKREGNEAKLIQAVLDWATLILPDAYDIDAIHRVSPKRYNFFPDLCNETLQWRGEMHQVCQILKKNNINYSWEYPIFLRFSYGGRFYRVETKKEVMEKLREHGIINKEDLQEKGKLDEATGVTSSL